MKQILNESYILSNGVTEEDKKIAMQLTHDPNNELVVRCYHNGDVQSIAQYGYVNQFASEFTKGGEMQKGEGDMYGTGVYCFYRPDGALKRVGTGGVGGGIMQCVIVNGFKNCVIMDPYLSRKYYGTDNFVEQLKKLFSGEDINKITSEIENIERRKYNASPMGWSAPIMRGIFGKNGKFKGLLEKYNIRGLVYNGGNDPHACVMFNAREVLPIAVTNNVNSLNSNPQWDLIFTNSMKEKSERFGDAVYHCRKLKHAGIIKSYEGLSGVNYHVRVTLKNGKQSYFNTKIERLVSTVGFDSVYDFDDKNKAMFEDNGIQFYLKYFPEKDVYAVIYDAGSDIKDINERFVRFWLGEYEQNKDKITQTIKGMLNESVLLKEQKSEEFDYGNMNDIQTIQRSMGLKNGMVAIYHRTPTEEGAKQILQEGFSEQFKGENIGNCYGRGMYFAMNVDDSNKISSVGRYMVKAYLPNGYRNIVIYNENIAKRVYGENYRVIDQIKTLCTPQLPFEELYSKYGENLANRHVTTLLDIDELQKTKIKGIIYDYSNIWAVVVLDFRWPIPVEYSVDNGRTWIRSVNGQETLPKCINRLKRFSDVELAMSTLKKDKIITWHDIAFQGDNMLVKLKNGRNSYYNKKLNKIISDIGFDDAYTFDYKLSCADIEIGGLNFKLYYLPQKEKYVIAFMDNDNGKPISICFLETYNNNGGDISKEFDKRINEYIYKNTNVDNNQK